MRSNRRTLNKTRVMELDATYDVVYNNQTEEIVIVN